jgi:hypothetical protein
MIFIRQQNASRSILSNFTCGLDNGEIFLLSLSVSAEPGK